MVASDKRRVLSVSIKDCEVQSFAAGGPGGQHQNATNTGIRIIHHPSGARGESREHRSQLQNRQAAFRRLGQSRAFQGWVAGQLATGPTPEERVEADLAPGSLRIEYRQNGHWEIQP